ncbi:hypothetical protein ACFL0J_00570 [Candidatus Neomarinimicrobiota bacterium]
MNKIKIAIILLIAFIISNCTNTKVVTFTDPDARGKSYNRIGVVANVDDLSERVTIEEKMVKTFLDNGISAVSSISLIPPTREFTVEQENEIFKNNRIDALAIIQLDDSGYFVTTEPMSVHTETRKKDGKKVKSTTVTGGGTEQKAFSKFRVSLVDLESNKTMWIGDADSRANFDSIDPDWDMEMLLKASSKKIVQELLKTGLVR